MDLLVIKTEGGYIRIQEEGFVAAGLDKASVYPMAQLETVRQHLARARAGGFPMAAIYRLTLTEAPWAEEP